jgi:hypothetical protein
MNNNYKTDLIKSLNNLTNTEYIDNSRSRTLKHYSKIEESKKELSTKDVLEVSKNESKSLNKKTKKNNNKRKK